MASAKRSKSAFETAQASTWNESTPNAPDGALTVAGVGQGAHVAHEELAAGDFDHAHGYTDRLTGKVAIQITLPRNSA